MEINNFLARFRARFPERVIEVGKRKGTVVISGACPEIGSFEVADDGDELIVFVGDFTHGHFDCYDESLTNDQIEQKVVEDVLRFFENVFSNKLEFYRGPHGGGGWRPAGTGSEKSYTWSGV